jgi:hypothetical protein
MATALGNATEVRRALLNYAPDLQKELTKEWGIILKPVVSQARSYVPDSPMRGWSGFKGKTINEKTSMFRTARFPVYAVNEIKAGIVYQTTPSKPTRLGYVNLVRIKNKSAAGAIFETAGRKNGQGQNWVGPRAGGASKGESHSNNPYAGNQFISNLGQLYGSGKNTGRLIYRAWANTQGRANAAVIHALENTTERFNKRTSIVDIRRAA